MPPTLLLGRTAIAKLLTVDDCLAAVEGDEEITVFDSTGTALQDVAAAVTAYDKAVRRGRGETIDLGH